VPPKKEATPAAAEASTKAEAAEKKPSKEKTPKAPAGEKAATRAARKDDSRGRGRRSGRPAADKPVEMVGGVAKQPTAEELLKRELSQIKVRKARGEEHHHGLANILASFTTRWSP